MNQQQNSIWTLKPLDCCMQYSHVNKVESKWCCQATVRSTHSGWVW